MKSAIDAGRQPLFMLAFDHRSQLRGLALEHLPVGADPSRVFPDLKLLVVEATTAAVRDEPELLATPTAGILLDDEYGAAAIREARARGLTLAVPIERSGAPQFLLDRGDSYADNAANLQPDYAKALVSLNPEDPGDGYEQQLELLATASAGLRDSGLPFLLEILLPPTPAQLQAVGGDRLRFDRSARPELVGRVITDCGARGIDPAMWKLEGFEAEADCRAVAERALGVNPDARCLVLGRGAEASRVEHWLWVAAHVPEFVVGFAVGRSIWQAPVLDFVTGRISRFEAVAGIESNYLSCVRTFVEAQTPSAAEVTP